MGGLGVYILSWQPTSDTAQMENCLYTLMIIQGFFSLTGSYASLGIYRSVFL